MPGKTVRNCLRMLKLEKRAAPKINSLEMEMVRMEFVGNGLYGNIRCRRLFSASEVLFERSLQV